MSAYVALLRGINVGGNNLVSMKSLKAAFEQDGFQDVSTYINSGNVLFRAKGTDMRRLERRIDAMLGREFDLPGRTVVRSHPEMARLVDTIARTWTIDPGWRYYVMFLRHTIDSRRVLESIVPKPEVEQLVYCPGALLWAARISGLTRSTVGKVVSQPIYKDLTVRNVNTTTKVFELMDRMVKAK